MKTKRSVYFGPPLAQLIGALPDGESVSGRLNRTAERYLEILARHGLDLTDAERQILGDCLSGSWVEPLLIRHLDGEVRDSEAYEAGDPAALSLVAKLAGAPFADLVATVEKLHF